MTNQQKIVCPDCGCEISIDDVLTHQIEDRIKKELSQSQKAKEAELSKQAEELDNKSKSIEKMKEEFDANVAKQVATKLTESKTAMYKELSEQAEKEQRAKTDLLEEQLKAKETKLEEATKNEIALRKEKMKLDEDKKQFELEKMRQLEEAKKEIMEEASKKATEEQQYNIAQLHKKLEDVTKAKDELARKLEQGSQQTQGEVLELMLEEVLLAEFPFDEVVPVPKGIKGADVIQKVIDRSGVVCGQIIWESKKTKSWSEGWVQKLKDDQRNVKADLAVIVTHVLPSGVNGFMFRDGIWICDTRVYVALATALRLSLESVSRERKMAVGKNEKMEVLYAYLTGVEFRQRVEAIVEAFSSMEAGLKKERRAYEKIWSEREQQIKKVMSNTVGMYGDLSGLVALQQIKMLELDAGEVEEHE